MVSSEKFNPKIINKIAHEASIIANVLDLFQNILITFFIFIQLKFIRKS